MSVGGGCEPGVTARSRCRWINVMKCGRLLTEWRMFPLKLKGVVYKSYIRSEKVCMEVE